MSTAPEGSPLRVSVVCTANRFRSPIVEAVLREEWPGGYADVDSYAAAGPSGMPVVGDVVGLMRGRGYDLTAHRSRAIEAGCLADRDLVIAFEASHAAAAIFEGSAPRECTFLIRDLLDVLPPVHGPRSPRSADEVRALLERIDRYRMKDFLDPRHQFADPMAGSRRRFPGEVAGLCDVGSRVAARLRGLPEPQARNERRWWGPIRRG